MRVLVVVVAVAACGRLHFDALGDGGPGSQGSGDAAADAAVVACGARVGAGRSHFCVRRGGGGVSCWGLGTLGQLGDGQSATHLVPTPVALPATALSVNGGRDESCAVMSTGEVECWGENGFGQLGDSSMTGSPTPVGTVGLTGVDEVWPAAQHSCARAGASIYCWGDGSSGRLGTGNTNSSLVPVQVPSITTAMAMSAGGSHACAILGDGTMLCWGYNASGQLGNNSMTDALSPIQPIGLGPAMAVSMRDLSTCAIRASDGGVMCWGRNDYGQVGEGDFANPVLVPAQVMTAAGELLIGASAIASGIQHECAIVTGNLWCWGDNQYGQLAQPTSMTNSPRALEVTGLPPIAQVSLSGYTTCALDTSGTIHCFGYGTDGQLGNNSTTNAQPVPQVTLDACM